MVVVVKAVEVVASEPPRLCNPGEWSDNAATGFTVLYHPFCLSPLPSLSLARAAVPFHPICNFPAFRAFLVSPPPTHSLYPLVFIRRHTSRRTRTLRQTPPLLLKRLTLSRGKTDGDGIEHR